MNQDAPTPASLPGSPLQNSRSIQQPAQIWLDAHLHVTSYSANLWETLMKPSLDMYNLYIVDAIPILAWIEPDLRGLLRLGTPPLHLKYQQLLPNGSGEKMTIQIDIKPINKKRPQTGLILTITVLDGANNGRIPSNPPQSA